MHFIGVHIDSPPNERRRTQHAATIKRIIVFDNCALKVFFWICSVVCVWYMIESVVARTIGRWERMKRGKIDYAKIVAEAIEKKNPLWKWTKKKRNMFRLIWFLWILFARLSINPQLWLLWRCVTAHGNITNNNGSQSWVNSIFEVHERAFARLICYAFFFSFSFYFIVFQHFHARMKNEFPSVLKVHSVVGWWIKTVHNDLICALDDYTTSIYRRVRSFVLVPCIS